MLPLRRLVPIIRLAVAATLCFIATSAFATAEPVSSLENGSSVPADTEQPSSDGTDDDEQEHAEPPAETDAIEESIVVTGSLIEDTLQETPESVAVWGADTLTDAGMNELQDVFQQTANAYQLANGEGFGIRGINHSSVGTGGSGELGSYYVDGVAVTGFAKRFGPMQLWDVDQIEILRGPQTTNVGRNALAGAVVLNTKEPVFRRENRWRLGVADETTWDLAGMANAQVGDSGALRFTAESWNTDGFVTNPTRGEDDFDARENLTLRAKYLYHPATRDDGFRLLLTAQYSETRRGNDLVDLSDPEARVNTSNLDDFEENDSVVLSLDLGWSLGDRWSLRSISSLLDSEYRRFDDDDQGPGGGDSFRGRDAFDRNWAQDIRFSYDGGDIRGVTGVYYTEVELENNTVGETNVSSASLGIPAPLLPFYPETLVIRGDLPATFDTTNIAVFTRWDRSLGERWKAFAGLRWDLEEQTSDSRTETSLLSELPDPAALPPQVAGAIRLVNALLLSQLGTSAATTDTDYDAFLPELGVSYDWNDSVTSSLFLKRGYRAGGAELSLTGRQNEYDPETLDLVEFSVRSLSREDRLAVNTNLYFGSWTDQQVDVQQSDNVFDFITENAGESEIYGFELDFRYRALSSWDVYGSLGFAHTEFTKFQSAAQGDLSGNRFTAAPEWTAAIGANYRFGKGWFLHGDIGYQSSAFANVENDPELRLDSRTLINVRGGYETGRYSILAYLENATDEVYAVTAFRNVGGRFLGKIGAPRQAGVQVTLRF
ncbi:MAG: TonB-dependent receptor [Thermoanaerobaculia bacterium]|nr:TonB-dependent receptor [Thermoanaerobaculia bacterium]